MTSNHDEKRNSFIEEISNADALRFQKNFNQIVATQSAIEFDFSLFNQ